MLLYRIVSSRFLQTIKGRLARENPGEPTCPTELQTLGTCVDEVGDTEEQRQSLCRSDEEDASTNHHHNLFLDNLLIARKWLIINIYLAPR